MNREYWLFSYLYIKLTYSIFVSLKSIIVMSELRIVPSPYASPESIPAGKGRKPEWLRVKLPRGKEYAHVRQAVDKYKLHTICESGNCPNMGECWGAGTATFMILGNVCTRSCGFCAVATVITSVNRDERKDRGAEIWYQTVQEVKKLCPATTIETLIPDVRGTWEALYRMISAGQEVVSHNMETIERLYRKVRPQAKYARSLEQIKRTKEYGKRTKSGIMLGLGEVADEVYKAMDELVENGLDILTLGQYLQPTKRHLEVVEYVHPDTFAHFKEEGLKRGLKYVEAGPLVRSSYRAEKHVYV